MKPGKIVGVSLLACFGILALYIFFWIGAGVRSDREVKNSVKTVGEKIYEPEVQTYIKTWVNHYVLSNSTWKMTAGISAGEDTDWGYSEYFQVSIFDWSVLGIDPALGHIVLSGNLDNPDGVLFRGAGRSVVVYSFGKHPSDFGYWTISSENLTQVTDNIFFCEPDLDD